LPFVAIILTTVMGFAGMAVDVAYLEYQQQWQQSATDIAAAGGAEALGKVACGNSSAGASAAQTDASNNGFTTAGNVLVTINTPPSSGPYAGNTCAVAVNIATQHVQTFFARFFGYPQGMTESTQAVGVASANAKACIYLLSTSQSSDMSNSTVNAPGCNILISNTADMANSTIDAAAIEYAGSAPTISGATFPEATPAAALAASDPCPSIPGCAYLTGNPPSTSGCAAGGSYSNTTLNQGCYNKMSLSGNVTLNPGLYIINGQFHLNGGTVTGSGVTFYMTANVSDTNFGNATLTLSAPTTGSTEGVLLYRIPSQGSAVSFSGCTCDLGGLLYFPTTQVNYSNAGGQYAVLVFGQANFSSSSNLNLGTPPPNGTLMTQAVLAE